MVTRPGQLGRQLRGVLWRSVALKRRRNGGVDVLQRLRGVVDGQLADGHGGDVTVHVLAAGGCDIPLGEVEAAVLKLRVHDHGLRAISAPALLLRPRLGTLAGLELHLGASLLSNAKLARFLQLGARLLQRSARLLGLRALFLQLGACQLGLCERLLIELLQALFAELGLAGARLVAYVSACGHVDQTGGHHVAITKSRKALVHHRGKGVALLGAAFGGFGRLTIYKAARDEGSHATPQRGGQTVGVCGLLVIELLCGGHELGERRLALAVALELEQRA